MKALFLFLVLALSGAHSTIDFETAVMRITGAAAVEELDESVMERFRALAVRPVDLNGAGRSRLLATGLFTQFQVASLLDYMEMTGDVLSFTELALVDGFPADFVEALRLFVTLESRDAPGRRHGNKVHGNLMLRGAVREQEGLAGTYGIKAKVEYANHY